MSETSDQRPTGAEGFDFLWGSWEIAHERLVSRLTGSNVWETFTATGECWPLLGGLANVDTCRARWRGIDFEGASLRTFDPATGLWSIYWVDNVGCRLLPPVSGRFVDGAGEFSGDDTHEGRPVRVRFRWSEITPDSARWEQAFSADDGRTWEVNWVMRFTRRAQHATPPELAAAGVR